MGIRFRRTVKIMPGVRLNFSKSGISTSIGVRGASVTVGKRGVYANTGLPGTGLSQRTRIDSGGTRNRSASRAAYRELRAQAAAAEKVRQLELAQSEVEQFTERIERLTTILKQREVEVFDWPGLLNADKGYAPTEFTPPNFDVRATKKSLNRESSVTLWRWAVIISTVLLATDFKGFGVFGLAASLIMLGKSYLERRSLLKGRLKRHEMHVAEARAKHEEAEGLRKWRAGLAPALRELQTTRNAEPLVELLTEELANEDLPLPLVFEIEFEDLDSVTIDLTLPDTGELPSERLSLTARGKLSRKSMTQRDRRSIYGALCCGLALRLIHEAFRVIPSLKQAAINGFIEVKDPATGHDKEIAPLKLTVSRHQLEALNLDEVDPEAALEGMGGSFNCNSRLQLKEA